MPRALLLFVFIPGVAFAAESPPIRSLPPTWSQQQRAPFFSDARKQLVGSRPSRDEVPPSVQREAAPGRGRNAGEAGSGSLWSETIDADALLAEIKRLNNQMAAPLANPSRYQGGESQLCRRNLGVLAVLFAVVEQFDEPLRLKGSAPAMRHALAKASRNAVVATEQSFAEACQRKANLDDLLRGESIDVAEPAPLEKWSELASRPLLMQRMEQAQQEVIEPALASARVFARTAPRVREEAQLLCLLAQVMGRPDYDFADDEKFVAMSRRLVAATRDLASAAREGDYSAAQAAAGKAAQSCNACHEDFRG